MNRQLHLIHVGPEHPPRRRSAATMSMQTREDGAVSSVRISIDLGLKNQQLGIIEMSTDEALDFIEKLVVATNQARKVNGLEGGTTV